MFNMNAPVVNLYGIEPHHPHLYNPPREWTLNQRTEYRKKCTAERKFFEDLCRERGYQNQNFTSKEAAERARHDMQYAFFFTLRVYTYSYI